MIERSEQDRRKQKQKIENDNRSIIRRKEDRDNLKAYYFVLSLSIFVLFCIGFASLIWEK